MRNIVKLTLTTCLIIVLSGCVEKKTVETALLPIDDIKSNENIIYSQNIDIQSGFSNLYVTIGKSIKISNEIIIKPNDPEMFTIEIILDNTKENNKLTFNKAIKSCEKENIDVIPFELSAIENKAVIDSLKKEKDLKTGIEIALKLCRTEKESNAYYSSFVTRKYSISSF